MRSLSIGRGGTAWTCTYENGDVSSDTKETVNLTDVSLFGVPIVNDSDTCQTETPADVELSGTGFAPATGGRRTAQYRLPPFGGCGLLTPFISAFASGPGNTIAIGITPSTS